MSQMPQAFAPAASEPVNMDNQTKFSQAKMDSLEGAQCDHVVKFTEKEKIGNKLARKGPAQLYLRYPPFKVLIFDDEHKQDKYWLAQCEYAELKARNVMLQPELVDGKWVHLSELQKRDIRVAGSAYEAFKRLSNLVYQKGDVSVLMGFEQELAAVLADKKLMLKDVTAWLSKVYDLVNRVRSVAELGEFYLPGSTVRSRIVYSIPSRYEAVKSFLKTMARLRDPPDNTDLEIRQELLAAERTWRQEAAGEGESSSDDAGEVVKSAQASFSARQSDYGRQGDGRDHYGQQGDGRDHYGRQGDGRDHYGRQGDGRDHRGGRGRGRGRGRGGGRDYSQVKCFRCKEKGHVAAKCPAPAVVEDEDMS